MAPPRTPGGMAEIAAPTLGAQRQYDRHHARHPVRRGGVHPGRRHNTDVLGVGRGGRTPTEAGEHRRDTVGASQRPAGERSVSTPVIWPTDLTCPMFSATRAITAGQEHRQPPRSTTASGTSAAQPAGRRDARGVDLAECTRPADSQPPPPGRSPASRSGRGRSQRRHQQHQGNDADQWALLEVRLGGRGEVEPISATIAPVTTGGSVTSIQCVPTSCTVRPMPISSTPTATNPPSALPAPCAKATAAVTGAITEAGAQMARQPVAGDQQEQERADTGEQRGWSPAESRVSHRHWQERRPEHRRRTT